MQRNTRVILLTALAVLILAAAAINVLLKHRQSTALETTKSKPIALAQKTAESSRAAPVSDRFATGSLPRQTTTWLKTVVTNAAADTNVQTAGQTKRPGSKKKVFQDPLAREALALVGTDPYAEDYWFAALNNPALPQSERQDLVDDLNEEGFADPKHPTIDELPLLIARMQLLEDAAMWLGDQYEWEEPYRDLQQMARVAAGSQETIH